MPTVLALAYVMNLSGQTDHARARGSPAPAASSRFLSPIIGWLGVAVTGSDTSSNSLFGALQVTAAKEAGLDPTLLAAANSLRRRARQDDLAAEPRDRRRRGRHGRPGGRPLPQGDRLEPAAARWSCACSSTCSPRRCSSGWSSDVPNELVLRARAAIVRRRVGLHARSTSCAPTSPTGCCSTTATPGGGGAAGHRRGGPGGRARVRARRACRGSRAARARACPAARCRSRTAC